MNRVVKYALIGAGVLVGGVSLAVAALAVAASRADRAFGAGGSSDPLSQAMAEAGWRTHEQLNLVSNPDGSTALYQLPGSSSKVRVELVDDTYRVIGFTDASDTEITGDDLPEDVRTPGLSRLEVVARLRDAGLLA